MSVTLKYQGVIFKNRLNDRKCSLEQGEIQSPRRKIPNDLGHGLYILQFIPLLQFLLNFLIFYEWNLKKIPSDYILCTL